MLRTEDISEFAYGSLKTGLDRWDKKRMDDGTLLKDEIWKKAGFYGYLVPGVVSVSAQLMNWMPRQSAYTERISHGFIFGFPDFIMDMVDAFSTTTTAGAGGAAQAAIREAERIARGAGHSRRTVGQSTKPGFEDVEIA